MGTNIILQQWNQTVECVHIDEIQPKTTRRSLKVWPKMVVNENVSVIDLHLIINIKQYKNKIKYCILNYLISLK